MATRPNRRRAEVTVARTVEESAEWLVRVALLVAVVAAVLGGAATLNGGL